MVLRFPTPTDVPTVPGSPTSSGSRLLSMELPAMCTLVPDASVPTRLKEPFDNGFFGPFRAGHLIPWLINTLPQPAAFLFYEGNRNAQRNVCRKKLTDFRRGGRPRPPGSGVFPFSGTSGEFGIHALALSPGEARRCGAGICFVRNLPLFPCTAGKNPEKIQKKSLTSKKFYAILSELPKTAGANVNPAEVR